MTLLEKNNIMLNKEGKYEYRHPRAIIAVDGVILSIIENDLRVLIISEDQEHWRLPGRKLRFDEINGNQWGEVPDNYQNGDELKRCLSDAIRLKIDGTRFSEKEFVLKMMPEMTPLKLRDCPNRDKDRPLIEVSGIDKKDRVITQPYMMLVNPYFFVSKENETNQRLRLQRRQRLVNNFFVSKENETIEKETSLIFKNPKLLGKTETTAYWAPLYQIFKDNDCYEMTIERKAPNLTSNNIEKRPSQEERNEKWVFRMLFDHAEILLDALQTLRLQARTQPVGRDFFISENNKEMFTMQQIKRMYDLIIDGNLELSNLKKTLKERNLIKEYTENGKVKKNEKSTTRPAVLFKYDDNWYDYYMENKNLALRL